MTDAYHDLPDNQSLHELSQIEEVPSELEVAAGGSGTRMPKPNDICKADRRITQERISREEREHRRRFPSGRPEHNRDLAGSGYYGAPEHLPLNNPFSSRLPRPQLDTDDFWMQDDGHVGKMSTTLKGLAKNLMAHAHAESRSQVDRASQVNDTISGRPGQSSDGGWEKTGSGDTVKELHGTDDIFAGYHEQQAAGKASHEARLNSYDRKRSQQAIPPVSLVESRGRTMSRLSVQRRVGTQFSPERPVQPRKRLEDDGGNPFRPAHVDLICGGRPDYSPSDDSLDFDTCYKSYEVASHVKSQGSWADGAGGDAVTASFGSNGNVGRGPQLSSRRMTDNDQLRGEEEIMLMNSDVTRSKDILPYTPYIHNNEGESVSSFMSSTMSSNINLGGQS